jgi:4,4'-diaponeurosporenoate glycosyltransferase
VKDFEDMDFISLSLLMVFWIFGFLLLWRIPLLWRKDLAGLPPAGISVIIPARNEGNRLIPLLQSLEEQSLKPREVILVDDHSEDSTAEIGKRSGSLVIPSADFPEGWTGKPWGCLQGAKQSQGDILVFLDADTVLERDGLEKLVSAFLGKKGLVTVQPYHRMERGYERLSAIFNILVLAGMNTFTPFGAKGKPLGAFGPCNVCSREDYFAVGGHEKVRGEVLESLGLGKEFLKRNLGVHAYGGKGTVSFRMYPEGIRSLVEGFNKGFGIGAWALSPGILFMTVGWVTGGVGIFRHTLHSLLVGDFTWFLQAGALYALYVLQVHWMLRRIGNFGLLAAILFPLPLLFFVGVFTFSFIRIFLRGKVQWKGREVKTFKKEG